MRLEKLVIHELPGVACGTTLRFHDGFNVLLGRNGTGKSTLLRLVVAVLRGDFSLLAAASGDVEWRVRSGDQVLTFRFRWQTARPGPEEMRRRHGAGLDFFEWAGEVLGGERRLVAGSAAAFAEVFAGGAGDDFVTLQPVFDPQDLVWPVPLRGVTELRLLTRALQRHVDSEHPGRFDEGTRTLDAIFGGGHTSGLADGIEPVRAEVAGDVVTRAGMAWVSSSELAKKPDQLEYSAKNTEWIEAIRRAFGAEAVKVIIGVAERGNDRVLYNRPRVEVRFGGGVSARHDRLSFGQQRLLAFGWYAACTPSGPLVVDELVNGMHHAWIRFCVDHAEPRQVFAASQNPLLLDALSIPETVDEVCRMFIRCSIDEGGFVWRSMSEAEGQEFLGAYDVGIQHVGRILRSRGLW